MALTISEFRDTRPFMAGIPFKVTAPSAGAFTFDAETRFARIQGSGSITWPTDVTPEPFDGTEYREVTGAVAVTIA